MIDDGYVKADRKVWEDRSFRDLLEAAMWNYLYQNAMWRDGWVFINGHRIDLQRGEVFTTPRYLAKGFDTSEKRVRSFLENLLDRQRITIRATNRGSIITICNYDQIVGFKKSMKKSDAVDGRTQAFDLTQENDEKNTSIDANGGGRAKGQPRGVAGGVTETTDIEQQIEENEKQKDKLGGKLEAQIKKEPLKELKNDKTLSPFLKKGGVSGREYSAGFETAWLTYRTSKSMSKAESWKSWNRALATGVSEADLLRAVNAYNTDMDKAGTDRRYVAHMTTWLNQLRFEAYLAAEDAEAQKQQAQTVNAADLSPQKRLILKEFGSPIFSSWFSPVEIVEQHSEGKGARCFVLRFPTAFKRDYCKREYKERLQSAFSKTLKSPIDMFFEVQK